MEYVLILFGLGIFAALIVYRVRETYLYNQAHPQPQPQPIINKAPAEAKNQRFTTENLVLPVLGLGAVAIYGFGPVVITVGAMYALSCLFQMDREASRH